MKEKKLPRDSNYELMRIISMIMIIVWHIIIHGEVMENSSPTLKVFLTIIQALIFVHVNSFILVSGYFMSKTKLKLRKVIKIINQVWFYKAIIAIIFVLTGTVTITKVSFVKLLSPFIYEDYWFITIFLVLMLLSPLLNIIVNNVSKLQYKKILILLFILFSIIPTIGGQQIYNNQQGYSLENFMFLYLIGAYLRKYPLEDNYIFKPMTKNLKRLIHLIIIALLVIFSTSLFYFANSIEPFNNFTKEISYYITTAFNAYDSPLIIIQSIFYFSLFGLFSFKNKLVNFISPAVFGVYLIHDNNFIRPLIYNNWFNFNQEIYYPTILIKILIVTIIIFITCAIIELIRLKLFKIISNRKTSKKITNKTENFIDSLGIKLSW